MTKRRTMFDSHEWTRFASTESASGKSHRDFSVRQRFVGL
jgi:hypothetical protein